MECDECPYIMDGEHCGCCKHNKEETCKCGSTEKKRVHNEDEAEYRCKACNRMWVTE